MLRQEHPHIAGEAAVEPDPPSRLPSSSEFQWIRGLSATDHPAYDEMAEWGFKLQWSHSLPAMDIWSGSSSSSSSSNILQWSHGLPAMDTSATRPRTDADIRTFNGAMTSQPWIRRISMLSLRTARRFNGAMASQPWIHDPRRRDVRDPAPASMEPWLPSHGYVGFAARPAAVRDLASMEPWPPSHGYSPSSSSRSARASCFNGAMAFQPWIRACAVGRNQPPKRLQWSHGLSAMDTRVLVICPASLRLLQWSHGLSAMDTACTGR